jgi:ATP-dependent Clp protease ATP-binding subunit ClpC
MFERFTDESRRLIVLAQEECRRLGHDHIDPEHLLLAMLRLPEAMATRLLSEFGVDPGAMSRDMERTMGPGSRSRERGGHIPFQPQTKRVLELSLREAMVLGHRHIGTEHVLLALLRADGTAAAGALHAAGVDHGRTRERIEAMASPETYQGAVPPPAGPADPVEGDPSVRAIRAAKDEALDRRDFEAAASLRAEERELLRRLREREANPEAG